MFGGDYILYSLHPPGLGTAPITGLNNKLAEVTVLTEIESLPNLLNCTIDMVVVVSNFRIL